ncbi:MAG: hypothetical protein COA78_31375 [Blastopirellula sp.]|nr:MAG: hypothetical protein COA78_31375 [Blastopirellula sp.]
MRFLPLQLTLLTLIALTLGCNRNLQYKQAQIDAYQKQAAQISEYQNRASGLDANNQDLHSQLAQSQQQSKILQDEVSLLKKQLGDTANQLAQSQQMVTDTSNKVNVLEASTRHRGGASINPNNSLQQYVSKINIAGAHVRLDGDVIRIELPADQLFQPGTNTLSQNSGAILTQATAVIARNFPNNMIGVEGHTDNRPVNRPYTSSHQLSASMAQSVVDELTARYRMSPTLLFVVGHGPNHPVVSSATAAGQQRNRRIELVVYPEKSS